MSIQKSSAVIFTPGKVLEAAIDPDAIPDPAVATDTPRHALAWTTNIKIRPVDHDTVEWDAGSVEFSDNDSQVVSTSGSPKTLSPASSNGVWYVYKRFSSSTIQFTQNFSTAIGTDRIQLGIIVVTADTEGVATVLIKGDSGGPHISAQSIAVNVLSAITANIGDITAGTITGLFIRTAETGKRIEITDANKLDFYDTLGFQFADIEPVDGVFGTDLRIRTLGALSSLVIAPGWRVVIHSDLSLLGNDIIEVGDVELDSLTKDGPGAIQVNSDVDFNNHLIFNAPDLGGTPVTSLAGVAITLDPANFGNNLPITIEDAQALAEAVDNLVLGMGGGGELSVTANVDFGGFDALQIGELELDSLVKDGSGKIAIEDTVEFGSAVQIHFAAHEITDIGTDTRRVANIWANAAILDAIALRDGQDVAAQAGRTIIYVEGSGSTRQVKIRYPDGTTADLPGEPGEPADPVTSLAGSAITLDPATFGGNLPVTIEDVQALADAVDNLTLGSAVQLPPSVYLWASTESTSPGGSVTLFWFTSHSTSLELNQGIGLVTPVSSGSMVVNPTETTHYRSIASATGSPADTSGLAVVVSGVAPDPPMIDSFTIDADSVAPGGSTNLRWMTSDATEVEIEANISGEDPPGTLDLDGSIEVTPGEAVMFTLTARNAAMVSVEATVSVVIDYPSSASDPRLFVADGLGGNLTELNPDGSDSQVTSSGSLPSGLTNPTCAAFLNGMILIADSSGTGRELYAINPNGPFSSGVLLRILPTNFSPAAMTVFNERLLIGGTSSFVRSIWEFDPNGEDSEGTQLRAMPFSQSVITGMTVFNNRLLVVNSAQRIYEVDPDGSDSEGMNLRGVPSGIGNTMGMTVLGDRLLLADNGGDELWEIDPDGADDQGSLLRDFPSGLTAPTGMAVVPSVDSDATPIINSFTYIRSGTSVTFAWTTTHADEVRLQVAGRDNPSSYNDLYSDLDPDGSHVQSIPQSSGLYWRLRAINNEGPTTYSDGLIPS